mgnify:CR=1 FL=1
MKFEIKNYFSGNVQATVEIAARFEDEGYNIQLGAAVKAAYEAKLGNKLTDKQFLD